MLYEPLANGSDIRGSILPESKALLNEDVARRIGWAFATFLAEESVVPARIAIGRDPRSSGASLLSAFADGAAKAGCEVIDCSLSSTPALYMATREDFLGAGAGVMVTASHLPQDRNGFKFFASSGGLSANDILRVLRLAEDAPDEYPAARTSSADLMGLYCRHLIRLVQDATGKELPLEGMRILVDAGNGSGGFFAEKVLAPLGADTSSSVFLDPDGSFPNHVPNPEDERALEMFLEAVRASGVDFGILFDTDVDRAAFALAGGVAVASSRLIALASAAVLRDFPGTTVVTDSVTSASLTPFIESRGGKHLRYMRGYNNVISKAKELSGNGTAADLAIETSGHCAFSENDYLDDGAYLAVKVLSLLASGTGIQELLAGYEDPAQEMGMRLDILSDDYKALGARVLADFREFVEKTPGWSIDEPNHEGIRAVCGPGNGDGWILVRMSLHDPQIPINMESSVPGGCDAIAARLDGFLAGYGDVLKKA